MNHRDTKITEAAQRKSLFLDSLGLVVSTAAPDDHFHDLTFFVPYKGERSIDLLEKESIGRFRQQFVTLRLP
jgi:hypothetical protein